MIIKYFTKIVIKSETIDEFLTIESYQSTCLYK